MFQTTNQTVYLRLKETDEEDSHVRPWDVYSRNNKAIQYIAMFFLFLQHACVIEVT